MRHLLPHARGTDPRQPPARKVAGAIAVALLLAMPLAAALTAAPQEGPVRLGVLDAYNDSTPSGDSPMVLEAIGGGAIASDAFTQRTEALCIAVHGHSAVWTGSHGIVFGGESGSGNPRPEIQRHDPATGKVTCSGPGLGSAGGGRHMTSAAWTGTHAFVFGGFQFCCEHLDDIVMYDPATNVAARLEDLTKTCRLPTARAHTSAVFGGTDAYIFGGIAGTTAFNETVAFSPRTCTVTVLKESPLPSARWGTSAVWDPRDLPAIGCAGGCAYIFGGHNGTAYLDDVLRFNPASGEVKTMAAKLPKASRWHTAVWDDNTCPGGVGFAYVFGAFNGTRINETWRYEPLTDTFTVTDATLPAGLQHTAAIWNGTKGFLYGGMTSRGTQKTIWEYTTDSCERMVALHALALAERMAP